MMFGFGKKTAAAESTIGVDISGNVINIIEIKHDSSKITVENFSSIEIPQDLQKEQIDDFVISTLKQTFSSIKLKKQDIFSILSGSEVVIRRIQIHKMGKKDLTEAIKWELKSHLPFPIEAAVINYTLLEEIKAKDTTKLELLVAAVHKESVEKTRSRFEEAGIHLDGISIAPFAAWNLLKKTGLLQKNRTTALINIGSETTKITFFNGENIEFYREVSLGGIHFTKAMIGLFVSDKWQMNLNYEQAEEVKRKYGVPEENTEETTEDGVPLKQIYQVLRPTLRRFLNEVSRSFSYYKEQFAKTSVDKVFVSGGSSKLKNIETHLSSELGLNVEKLENFLKFEKGKNITNETLLLETLPHMAIAIGTALSQAKEMNFIGTSQKRKLGLNDPSSAKSPLPQLNLSTKAYIALGLSGAVAYLAFLATMNISLNNGIANYRSLLDEKKALLSNLKVLSEKQAILSKIEGQKTPIRVALTELTNLMPANSYLDTFTFNNSSKNISISGNSADMNSVGDLLKKVEGSAFFSDTSLSEARRSADKKTVDFSMNLNLKL